MRCRRKCRLRFGRRKGPRLRRYRVGPRLGPLRLGPLRFGQGRGVRQDMVVLVTVFWQRPGGDRFDWLDCNGCGPCGNGRRDGTGGGRKVGRGAGDQDGRVCKRRCGTGRKSRLSGFDRGKISRTSRASDNGGHALWHVCQRLGRGDAGYGHKAHLVIRRELTWCRYSGGEGCCRHRCVECCVCYRGGVGE